MTLLLLSFTAGFITILSPCILPILPFLFTRPNASFRNGTLPLAIGLTMAFTVIAMIGISASDWTRQFNDGGRLITLFLFALTGASLISDRLSTLLMTPITLIGQKWPINGTQTTFVQSLATGFGTGFLWAPCAGPILGLIWSTAVSHPNASRSAFLFAAYGLGASTGIGLVLTLGQTISRKIKLILNFSNIIKKGLGLLTLLGVLFMTFNFDRQLVGYLGGLKTESFETYLLSNFSQPTQQKTTSDDSPANNSMMMAMTSVREQNPIPSAEIRGIETWLNSKPLNLKDLKGNVVLIDFWTYSCINCLRTLPYVKSWHKSYQKQGLIVVGIHTPEFGFEKSVANVKKAIHDLGIQYPVGLDNNYQTWSAFSNQYWPAHYLIDKRGQIRHTHFGEGAYDETEAWIKKLLEEESNVTINTHSPVNRIESSARAIEIKDLTPETYLGFQRLQNYGGKTPISRNRVVQFVPSKTLAKHHWDLSGTWRIEGEKIVLLSPKGKLRIQFRGTEANIVMSPGDKNPKSLMYSSRVNHHTLNSTLSPELSTTNLGLIDQPRLYRLYQSPSNGHRLESPDIEGTETSLLEIEFLNAGAEIYALTFG